MGRAARTTCHRPIERFRHALELRRVLNSTSIILIRDWHSRLPSALREFSTLHVGADGHSGHGLSETGRDLGELERVVVMRYCLDDGACARQPRRLVCRVDARADKDAVRAELHHERRVGGTADPNTRCQRKFTRSLTGDSRGDAAGGHRDNRKTLEAGRLLEQVVGSGNILGIGVELLIRHAGALANLSLDGALVPDGLNNVASAGLALGADHGSALANAAQRLPEVLAAADKRHLEVVLIDVVHLIGRS